jgi:hypothetical protein
MIATRFVPIVCGLLAIALVPTVRHSYADARIFDDRSTALIPASLAGYDGSPSDRNATWGQRRFESHDWTERMYRSRDDLVKLSVIRSFDAKTLYHHPELAVSYGPTWVRSEARRFSERLHVPVRVLYADSGPVALYVLQYGDRFVEDPIRFQLRSAAELLFRGRQAMTLFFLTDAEPVGGDIETLPALGVLFAAIDSFVGPAS